MQKRQSEDESLTAGGRWLSHSIAVLLLLGIASVLVQTAGKAGAASSRTPQKSKALPAPSADAVSEARRQLQALGYWVNPKGAADEASLRHALIASQKIENRPRTGVLTMEELQVLRTAKRPEPLETGYPHIEIDLDRQVLFLVEIGDVPLRILPVSSGSGEYFTEGGRTRRAVTPQGRFTVQRKIKGWRKSPLGLLYYPNYFYDGVAIHGNPSVPPLPASHGCIRIPMFAAQEFSELAIIGMVVIVYDNANPMAPVIDESRRVPSAAPANTGIPVLCIKAQEIKAGLEQPDGVATASPDGTGRNEHCVEGKRQDCQHRQGQPLKELTGAQYTEYADASKCSERRWI